MWKECRKIFVKILDIVPASFCPTFINKVNQIKYKYLKYLN